MSATTRPRVGFLGVGWIGRHRMAAMLATGAIEAAAISDPSAEMVTEAAALVPGAAIVDDLDAMLALGLDGVVIATPSALHADQSIRALSGGAAVFCQKPLGRDADEAARVVEAAERADRLLSVDFSYRLTSGMQAIAGLLREGALGRVFAIDLVFHNAYGPDKPWFYDRAQSGGGCVMDLGVHLVDLALWALGADEPATVEARLFAGGTPLTADAVEDYAVATLTLADGTAIRLACSWRLNAGVEAEIGATFYGTSGGARLRNIGGSFYDFAAERFAGTTTEALAPVDSDWGGRAAADWARRLAAGARFDPKAKRLVTVARTLDRIYAWG
ncbi:Gfo/Idh/MocA family oxidoreductase [Sphingomonas sp. KR1UV-12]|uniref:Gfo/Idh/MocA family oxidoreductase n=1 Tax=Sphingomonas aurea TaxID=3063994 RepID=A0ABT9EHN8_9SPHN|nr:Gfo/Idh/MocA family oxidoreductase [Sphingomonas sp. KR1UV-12]MDP1026471.1 Gfo/Idh/MocA family oxidoreductase [Sphingomonas sp. KR1UV-12]